MATAQTNNSLSAILKRGGYSDKILEQNVVREHPGLALLKREKDFFTSEIQVPIPTANNQNVSADISVALAGVSGAKYDKFLVTPVRFYGVGAVDGMLYEQMRQGGPADHFVDATIAEVNSVMETMGTRFARQMYGNRGGSLARIAAINGTTITLAQPAAAIYFDEDMRIQASAADGTSGTLRDSGDFVTVTVVNLDTGEITASTPWTDITGIAVGDYLFARGDFGATAAGFEDWNPQSSTPGTLYGMVRNTGNIVQKAGGRYSGTANGDTVDNTLQAALRAHFAKTGTRPEYVLMHPYDISRIEEIKEPQKEISSDKSYGLGIQNFTVHGVRVVEDPDAIQGIAQGVGKNGLVWKTCGTVPGLDRSDGLSWRLSNTADALEFRVKGYHNFISRNPKANFKIILPA